MIPQTFDYSAPQSLEEALSLVASGERKILAGGMSLIPMMKLRLATPAEVVDLGRIPGLNGIAEAGGFVHIGAMATHHAVETSPVVRARCPLLSETAGHIGDAQVRNMGTLGGSIAHADPAADYPAALLALEAQIRLVSATSDRTVEAADFFLDAFTTALGPGEIVLEVRVPVEDSSEGYCYEKVAHPASGFAIVGVAVRVKRSGGRIAMARIGVTGMGPHAFRERAAERLLLEEGAGGAAVERATAVVGDGEEANSDLYASADYRRHLAKIHARRALAVALSRAS
jgi:aerobic carbon-monoxide dehydrogenase medium subunit